MPVAAPRSGACPRICVDTERLFYCGAHELSGLRCMGGIVLYVALAEPLRFRLEGRGWQQADCVVVQPGARHGLSSAGGAACDLMIEPESVDLAALPAFVRQPSGAFDAPDFVRRMHDLAHRGSLSGVCLDTALFGRPLPRRRLDPRVAAVVKLLQAAPNTELDAAGCAAQVHLSPSRFLHLFKAELGCPYRRFRAWKRARMLLSYIDRPRQLTGLAQDIGYPDSSHFSHSIRQTYGLRPRDLFSGCSGVELVRLPAMPAATASRRRSTAESSPHWAWRPTRTTRAT